MTPPPLHALGFFHTHLAPQQVITVTVERVWREDDDLAAAESKRAKQHDENVEGVQDRKARKTDNETGVWMK